MLFSQHINGLILNSHYLSTLAMFARAKSMANLLIFFLIHGVEL